MTRESYGQAYQDGLNHTIRFLLSRGIARDTAMDVAQGAWSRGWERLHQLRDDRMVVTWVNTIALNRYRQTIRYEKRNQALVEPIYAKSGLNWAAIDLSRILAGCRDQDRALLEAQLRGITAKEIAEARGCSQTAVRIRLLRARRAARNVAETFAHQARRHAERSSKHLMNALALSQAA